MSDRFSIVYTKLAQSVVPGETVDPEMVSHQELDEIAELRRVILEASESDPICYTGT